jgi:hypothetical protein
MIKKEAPLIDLEEAKAVSSEEINDEGGLFERSFNLCEY